MERVTSVTGDSAALSLEAVGKDFESRGGPAVAAISEVSLTIRNGEFLSVVGPSGCGKSTLLNILAGFERPTTGRALIGNKPITGPSAERGMLFQEYALFPWKTVRENIVFGLKYGSPGKALTRNKVKGIGDKYLDLVGLVGSESKYPHELSGGMRQRTALARLLAIEPRVLLMDEPLAALDAQTRVILQEELLRIWGDDKEPTERKTVVFVTHAIEEAVFLSDRVAVMSSQPGRVIDVVDVQLARPRHLAMRTGSEFRAAFEHIWELIRDEAYIATL